MVAGGGIPRTDPYSFTAFGHSWVVQSWLPDWTYGWAHRLGGFRLVLLEQALLIAVLVWLVVRLARAGLAAADRLRRGARGGDRRVVLDSRPPAGRAGVHGPHRDDRRAPAHAVAAGARGLAVGQQPRVLPARPGLAGGAGGGGGARLAGLAPRRHALPGRVRRRARRGRPEPPRTAPAALPVQRRRPAGGVPRRRRVDVARFPALARPAGPDLPHHRRRAALPRPADVAGRGAGGGVRRPRAPGRPQPARRRGRARPRRRPGAEAPRLPAAPPAPDGGRPPGQHRPGGGDRWWRPSSAC